MKTDLKWIFDIIDSHVESIEDCYINRQYNEAEATAALETIESLRNDIFVFIKEANKLTEKKNEG